MDDLLDLLPPMQRLALAYAPAPAWPAWLALLALDARLGRQLQGHQERGAREPILTQIRLAWWRDRLREPADAWSHGEPLLAALGAWQGQHGALGALVDGWEMLLGEAPLPDAAWQAFVTGRAAAVSALAAVVGRPEVAADAGRMGAGWAIADLAARVSDHDERAAVLRLGAAHDWHPVRLPRALRPLIVLHGSGARRLKAPTHDRDRGSFLIALRLGILGF